VYRTNERLARAEKRFFAGTVSNNHIRITRTHRLPMRRPRASTWEEIPGRIAASDGTLLATLARVPTTIPATKRKRPLVLCINGLSNERFQLEPLAEEAAKRGARTLTYDFRGHGCSENPRNPREVSARAFAEDGWRCVDAFEDASECKIVIVAYSYGVQVGLEMCRMRKSRVECFIAVLGSPERILDGLMPSAMADATIFTATRVLGLRLSSWLLGLSLRVGASFSYPCHLIGRATGYLKSSYEGFSKPFFKHLARLDAETWARCVVDGHRNGAMDVFETLRDDEGETFVVVIAGDKDFAAPQRVMRSWERYADEFVMLRGCAHDGLRSHTEEILAVARRVFDRILS
jgi:pimeloyl-ACP methyl ester carboxylesterase